MFYSTVISAKYFCLSVLSGYHWFSSKVAVKARAATALFKASRRPVRTKKYDSDLLGVREKILK